MMFAFLLEMMYLKDIEEVKEKMIIEKQSIEKEMWDEILGYNNDRYLQGRYVEVQYILSLLEDIGTVA